MPEVTLDQKALLGWLPHRGVNLFVEEVWSNEERTKSRSRTRVLAGDPQGREALMRREAGGRTCWYEPFLAELMALTGVTLMHEKLAPKNQVSVFSMISRIAYHYLPTVGDEVIGYADITRQRGDFTQFVTRAEVDGKLVLEAEVMSGAAVLAEIASSPTRAFTRPQGEPVDAALFAWKPAHLRFVDRLISADPATRKVVCSYTYPSTHPFVPGHFPGAPLMMGVTQWAAAADAAWLGMKRFGIGPETISECKIMREDGSEILNIRGLSLRDEGGVPKIIETNRLAFREVVRPGDGMLVEATISPRPSA